MKGHRFLSLGLTPWALSLSVHLFFVAAVILMTWSRMVTLPLVTLDLAPLTSSTAAPAEDLDQWRKPLSRHHLMVPPKPQPTAPPSVGDQGPVRSVAQVGQMPRMKTVVKPAYPEAAKRANVEGVVILQVEIDASGTVMDAQVVKSLGSGCDEAALEAVKQTSFVPAYEDGKPVPVRIRIPYRFKIGE